MSYPPRFRNATLEELEDGLQVDPPAPEAKRPKRRKRLPSSETFDVRRWRLPSRWRNDKRVGDVAMSKMLRGIDLDRYEALARGEL